MINRIEKIQTSLGILPIKDESVEFTSSGVSREHKAGRNPKDGDFTQTNTPASLKVNLFETETIYPSNLNALKNENITIYFSNGKVVSMPNAFCENVAPTSDGELEVTFISNISTQLN